MLPANDEISRDEPNRAEPIIIELRCPIFSSKRYVIGDIDNDTAKDIDATHAEMQ